MPSPKAPMIVMQALGDPARGSATSNPYTRLLVESLPPTSVRTIYFHWRTAFVAKFDIFHVHWPELLFRHRLAPVRWLKCILFALFIMRMKVGKKAIVRTVHNLAPHESVGRLEGTVIRILDRMTTVRVVMNEATPVPSDAPAVLVPHGHYRSWYSEPRASSIVPGRVLTFGLIRAYKGIEDLVKAFRASTNEEISLSIAGRPDSEDTSNSIRVLAGDDPRVKLRLEFLPDAELEAEIAAASLVVLPYREIHNSGVALLALSLNRPVLVRESETTRLLAAEFGTQWVYLFSGELTPEVIEEAATLAQQRPKDQRVDMSSREWDRLATLLTGAYQDALERVRSSR